ncbi:UNVERIFIED_CONTAM: hypothetical protein Slati_2515900 [Sesamum latifolium]|uniref:Uncharacterized protein n=1 Tax=Sesamum latifolium TaxID=2727402 RepID=A0AAW2WF06_9LAMI
MKKERVGRGPPTRERDASALSIGALAPQATGRGAPSIKRMADTGTLTGRLDEDASTRLVEAIPAFKAWVVLAPLTAETNVITREV